MLYAPYGAAEGRFLSRRGGIQYPRARGEDGGTGAEDGGQLTFFTSMRPKELSFGCMSKVQYNSGFLRGEVTLRM